MEKIFKPMLIVKLKDNILHQGIGGKKIILERKMKKDDAPNNIALINYLHRRIESKLIIPDVIYYGHVNGFGYFVSEDEFDGEPKESTIEEYKEIW